MKLYYEEIINNPALSGKIRRIAQRRLLELQQKPKWRSTFWDYEKHIGKPGCEVRFLRKRVKFDAPTGLVGASGPTFPSAIIIMDRRGMKCAT